MSLPNIFKISRIVCFCSLLSLPCFAPSLARYSIFLAALRTSLALLSSYSYTYSLNYVFLDSTLGYSVFSTVSPVSVRVVPSTKVPVFSCFKLSLASSNVLGAVSNIVGAGGLLLISA